MRLFHELRTLQGSESLSSAVIFDNRTQAEATLEVDGVILALGFKADARDYGIGIQLLKDLGLRRVRLLTNNPKKTDAFIYGGFDLEVVDQVPILPPIHEHNRRYLQTKREKLGHRFPE